jgi:hypothetical protein
MPGSAGLAVSSNCLPPAVHDSHVQRPVKFGLEREKTVFKEYIFHTAMRNDLELWLPDSAWLGKGIRFRG